MGCVGKFSAGPLVGARASWDVAPWNLVRVVVVAGGGCGQLEPPETARWLLGFLLELLGLE